MRTFKKPFIEGRIDLIFREGINGPFPVGTLHLPFGSFACRDSWLETLDTGSYEGEFEIDEIGLRSYMTRGDVKELRGFIQASVSNYVLDTMTDEVSSFEYDDIDADPINDDDNTVTKSQVQKPQADVPQEAHDDKQHTETQPVEDGVTQSTSSDNRDDMEIFIREQLRTVGIDNHWQSGDALTIPAELGRAEQRTIKAFLLDNGYKLTDIAKRLWTVDEQEVGNV